MIVRQSQMQENFTAAIFFVILQVQLFIFGGTDVLYLTMPFISHDVLRIQFAWVNSTLISFPYSKCCSLTAEKIAATSFLM